MKTLAAILYEAGFPIDAFVGRLAQNLRAEGVRLGGVVQENAGEAAACASMSLIQLGTGDRFGISQALGKAAKGCRLDTTALADAEPPLRNAITDDVDLVIINKFGKAEAEGGGLRAVVLQALELGVPVLTAARPPHTEAWSEFHGGLADDLTADMESVLTWCREAIRAARPASGDCAETAAPMPR